MRGMRRVGVATVARTPKPPAGASCGGEEVCMWRKAVPHASGACNGRGRRRANAAHRSSAGQTKTQLCASGRCMKPDPRCLLGSVEHVELSRMLAEALAQYSAVEIGRPSGRGLGLNVGRLSQTREQAL